MGIIMKKTLFGILIITSLSSQAEVKFGFEFEKPDFDANSILNGKSEISFTNIENNNRSSGGSIFKKVAPSVVKILTNEGSGSGIVLSKTGVILTNEHVIHGYRKVGVVFSNDQNADDVSIGEVIKIDEISDLAIVKINSLPGLIPINLASSAPEIGDDVHAIGHPLGENWTYTRGYISQIRNDYSWQTGTTEHHIANVIQTQTPINPGNSGGPLLNENGELIGVNSFINSRAEGLNYAVDMSSVKTFLQTKSNRIRKSTDHKLEALIASQDDNKNGNPDFYVWDISKNKVGDMFGVDENEDLIIERIMFDDNENGKPELTIIRDERKGKEAILYFFDKNEDGEDEAVGIDNDFDGKIDKIVPL